MQTVKHLGVVEAVTFTDIGIVVVGTFFYGV
jgi:hypothetical protein